MRTELPVVAFISTVLVLIPLPWHWRARKIGTLSLIFWLASINLTRGINAIIWGGKTLNYAPIWCDICTKLVMGANWGFSSSGVCISRYLAQVSSPHYTIAISADKRRRILFEICMCVVLPLMAMALHYVVQGHRFDILEDFGCNPVGHLCVGRRSFSCVSPIAHSGSHNAGLFRHCFALVRLPSRSVPGGPNSTIGTSAGLIPHTVSRTSEKWDEAPASSALTSRPSSPSANNLKHKDTLDVYSRP